MLLKVCISLEMFSMTILFWGTSLIKPTQALLLGHVHSIPIRLNKLQRGYKVFPSDWFVFFSFKPGN